MLVFVIAAAPFVALARARSPSTSPDSWDNVLRYGYFPALVLGLVLAVTILYRVSAQTAAHPPADLGVRMLAAAVFVVATVGLRIYLSYITRTGYTYGALATPSPSCCSRSSSGSRSRSAPNSNAAIDEEWPPIPKGHKLRTWLRYKARSLRNRDTADARPGAAEHRERTGGLRPRSALFFLRVS